MTLPVVIQAAWPAVFFAAIPLLFWLAGRSQTRLGRRHLRVATLLRKQAPDAGEPSAYLCVRLLIERSFLE